MFNCDFRLDSNTKCENGMLLTLRLKAKEKKLYSTNKVCLLINSLNKILKVVNMLHLL